MDLSEGPDPVLKEVALAALVASEFHTGRFADGAIENALFAIGAALDKPDNNKERQALKVVRTKRRRVLHVATQVTRIGGLTRTMGYWVSRDKSSQHSLVITDQRQEQIPSWLSTIFHESGGEVINVSTAAPLDKARRLRQLAKERADLVVLHQYPSDVVPTIAFATIDCPPVVVFNHADHQFWLGSSVSDLAICFRSAASEHTVERRSIAATVVLHIPLIDSLDRPSKETARQILGIPADQVALLTVGRAEKYRPSAGYDFVRTAGKILDRDSKSHIYVVGETPAGIVPYLQSPVHQRLHFVGPVEDPSLWRAAADIYLESFPFGSHTALLEAALSGLPVVPAYAPIFPLIVTNDDSLQGLISNLENEDEYIASVVELIQSPQRRKALGEAAQNCLRTDHVGAGWLQQLAGVYERTDRLTHAPKPIPVSKCWITDSDATLSLWHAHADGENLTSDTAGNVTGAMLRHAAFVARFVNDYFGAVCFAMGAVYRDPRQRASWRVLALCLLGGTGRNFIGRVRRYFRQAVARFRGGQHKL